MTDRQKVMLAKIEAVQEYILSGSQEANDAADALKMLVELYKAMSDNGWISVKDRLPEGHECSNEDGEWLESDYVLTFIPNALRYYPHFYIGQTVDGVWDLEGSDFLEDNNKVTHWMPLPEPPEVKS